MSPHSEEFWRELVIARAQANRAAMSATRGLVETLDRQQEVNRVCDSLRELLPTVPARVSAAIGGE